MSAAVSIRSIAPATGLLAGGVGAMVAIALWFNPSALTAAAVCLVALVILRWPETGVVAFALVVTLVPFGVVPVRVVFAPSFVDVVLITLLSATVLTGLRTHRDFILSRIHLLVFVFLGLALVSLILGTAYSRISLEELRLFAKLVNSILISVVAVQIVRSEAALNRAVAALVLGGSLAALIAIGLYLVPTGTAIDLLSSLGAIGYPTGPDVMRPVEGTTRLRATGTSIDPNVLGGMLLITLTLAVAQLTSRAASLPRLLAGLGSVAMVVALGLSLSRSAWLGLAAALVFLAFRTDRRWLIALPAVAVGALLLPQARGVVDRLVAGLLVQDQASAMRLTEYREAFSLIAQYPAFGIGFGGPPTVDTFVGVSSLYLLIGEQMGLIGLAAFLATIGAALVYAFQLPKQSSRSVQTANRALQAALVGAMVAGLFDHYFFNLRFPHMSGLFWFVVALILAAGTIGRTNSGHSPGAGEDH